MIRKWILCSLIMVSGFALSNEALVDAFGKLPEMSQVKLSPSGDKFAYIRPYKGKPIIVVESLLGEPTKPIIFAVNEGNINYLRWVNEDRLVFNTRVDYRHPQNRVLYSLNRFAVLNAETGEAIWPFRTNKFKYSTVSPRIVSDMKDQPDHVLLKYQFFDELGERSISSLIDLDVSDGSRDEILNLAGDINFITDIDGSVLGYQKYDIDNDVWSLFWQEKDKGDFEPVTWLVDGKPFNYAIRHYQDGRVYFANKDDLGRQYFSSAPLLETSSANFSTEMSDPTFDIDHIKVNRATGKISGFGYYQDHFESQYLYDEKMSLAYKRLQATFEDAQIVITSSTQDGRYHSVYVNASDKGPQFYLYDAVDVGLSLLGEQYPKTADMTLSKTQRFDFTATDGTEIPGYLTLPNTTAPAPLVVMPHGGPHARSVDAFSWRVQYLTQLGYAVYRPNFRGSSGYGAAFEKLGYFQWGKAMQQDIYEGTEALLKSGLVANIKPCIAGGSYGGYAAMVAATEAQYLYQCAVSFAGVSSLDVLMKRYGLMGSSEDLENMFPSLRLNTKKFDFSMISPLHFITKDTLPIMLMHGGRDSVVPPNQSKMFAKQLEIVGHEDHLLLIGPNANHWFESGETRQVYLRELSAFLTKYLDKKQVPQLTAKQ